MQTTAITNQKGGCGKTATAVNVACALAQRGRRVLLIDLDPQAYATRWLGVDPCVPGHAVHDTLLSSHMPVGQVVLGTMTRLLHLVPGSAALVSAESSLHGVLGKEFILRELLREVSGDFDVCIIDCPPSLGVLTTSALVASTHVVTCVQPHYYASACVARLIETIDALRARLDPCSARLCGVALTFVEETPTYARQVREELEETFGEIILDTVIHKAAKIVEAAGVGESIFAHAPGSRAALEYEALATEIAARLDVDKP